MRRAGVALLRQLEGLNNGKINQVILAQQQGLQFETVAGFTYNKERSINHVTKRQQLNESLVASSSQVPSTHFISPRVYSTIIQPESIQHEECKIIGWSPQEVYNVVADVNSYQQFLPWCIGSTITKHYTDNKFDAELFVGFNLIQEKYISQVTLLPYRQVVSTVKDSAIFKELDSTWTFEQGPTPQSCLIKYRISFAFKNQLYRSVTEMVFNQVAKHMMQSFEKRCEHTYGSPQFSRQINNQRLRVQPRQSQ